MGEPQHLKVNNLRITLLCRTSEMKELKEHFNATDGMTLKKWNSIFKFQICWWFDHQTSCLVIKEHPIAAFN